MNRFFHGAVLSVLSFVALGNPVGAIEPTRKAGLRTHLDAFITAFNTGDEQVLSTLVSKHYQPGIRMDLEVNRWLRWHSIFGPLQIHSTVDESPGRLRVFARGEITRGWIELTLRASRTAPGKLRTIAVGTGLRPETNGVEGTLSPEEGIRRIESYVDRLSEKNYFSGSVLLAKNGRPILEKACGFAHRSCNTRNRIDTRFNIGSITKIFTAIAVFQHVQDGALSLDDPARQYVADYPGGLDPSITIRHLLTHTSGLGRGAFDAPLFPVYARTVADWLPLTVAEPEFPAGNGVSYSNGAFIILGAILEAVSGMSYDEYMSKHVYAAAGMTNSGALELDALPPNVAIGYTHARTFGDGQVNPFQPGSRRNSLFMNGIMGNPAGLTYSTAPDLLAFKRALDEHRLLNPEFTRQFLAPQVDIPGEPGSGVSRRYGFGWEFESSADTEFMGKDGGSWGVSARIAIYPRTDHTLIVLSNFESIAPIMASHIGDLLAATRSEPGEGKHR